MSCSQLVTKRSKRTFVVKLRVSKRSTHLNDCALTHCNYPLQCHGAHGDDSVRKTNPRVTRSLHDAAPQSRADPTLELDQVFPPPPHPLVDSHGGHRFLVERIFNHRDVDGERTSYLVRWRGTRRRGTAGSLAPS